jgi:thiosulfate reductase cytochrome b subunit
MHVCMYSLPTLFSLLLPNWASCKQCNPISTFREAHTGTFFLLFVAVALACMYVLHSTSIGNSLCSRRVSW